MTATDRRGATLSAADPPITTNPNPDLAWKAPVRAATTGSNITLSGLQTIDGVSLALADRVLVKDQTDATTNGLYNATTSAWTRTIDATSNSQFATGMQVAVTAGTSNSGTNWKLTTVNPITLGTSNITWQQVSVGVVNFTGDSGSGGVAGLVPAPSAGQAANDAVLKASGAFGVVGLTNARLAKTGPYSVLNADKGKTIALSGSTLYTLTVSVASGYDADFMILVVNEDNSAAKTIAINGLSSYLLWPLQQVIIYNDNNAWRTTGPYRWILTAATTFNVDPVNGADTNDGLSTGTGRAWRTIQGSITNLQHFVDLGGQNPTIQLVDGTYNENVLILNGFTGGFDVSIRGNNATPSNVIWNSTAANNCLQVRDMTIIDVSGVKFTGGASSGAILCQQSSIVDFQNCDFGTFGAGGIHIQASLGGVINYNGGTYTVSGNTTYHWYAATSGVINIPAVAISVPNALTFTTWAISLPVATINLAASVTFTGTGAGAGSTGKKYDIQFNSVLTLSGATLPGATAGTTANGGLVSA